MLTSASNPDLSCCTSCGTGCRGNRVEDTVHERIVGGRQPVGGQIAKTMVGEPVEGFPL